jgi:hypothetical protein
VLAGESQLVNEVPDVRVVEVHEFVYVGQVKLAAWRGRLGCWEGAAEDVLES